MLLKKQFTKGFAFQVKFDEMIIELKHSAVIWETILMDIYLICCIKSEKGEQVNKQTEARIDALYGGSTEP